MIKWTALFWIALLIVAGGTVMRVSYQVRHVQEHIANVNRDIQHEQDAIRVLNAEWNTLNDPSRIDLLARRYLTLEPTPIRRVVALEDIPFKPSPERLAQIEAEKKVDKAHAPQRSPVVEVKAPVVQPAPRGVMRVALPADSADATAALAAARSILGIAPERR